jgi:peptide/nickel transport system substrate-binding protein
MRLICSRSLATSSYIAAALFSAWAVGAATRPRYGGVLRVEIREPLPAADAPQAQRRVGPLSPAFKLDRWEPGRSAVYTADENAAGGRPFLDAVEIEMGRPLREQSIDLGLGKADVIEVGPDELRRPAAGRGVWSSAPVRVLALVFHPRIEDARVRESLALAVDRAAIHNVLLQRMGENAGALLPQWLSGYAFLFPTTADLAKARALAASLPPAGRRISLAAGEPGLQPIAERIALNARDAGLAVALAPPSAADVRLVEARIVSSDPARALAALAGALGLPEPPRGDSPEALYAAERALLDGFRAIPLFHLPDVYGAGPRVKGGPGITPLGEWRFENLWLEGPRP